MTCESGRSGRFWSAPRTTIPFMLLLAATLSNPWNDAVVASLRMNDILLCLALVATVVLTRFSKKILSVMAFLLLALFAPLVLSGGESQDFNPERLVFFYKYIFPLFVAMVAFSATKDLRSVRYLEWALFGTFIILVVWVYCYKALLDAGVINGTARVSFPGPSDFSMSDAHLYSSYLAISLIFYSVYLSKRLSHGPVLKACLSIIALGAVILTGSRNGVLAIIVAAVAWPVLSFSSGVASVRREQFFSIIVYFVFVLFAVCFILTVGPDFFSGTMERALNFQFTADESASSRVRKFFWGVADWQNSSVLVGAGMLHASLTWYDSGVAIILAHTGILGILVIFVSCAIYLNFVIKRFGINSPGARTSLIIFGIYFIMNGITEFALVSRSALPVVLYIVMPLISEFVAMNSCKEIR